MDERVLGDMPSEGSDGGRRFGIYRAYSPDPKMHSISRVRVVFVVAIAAVVAFAVFFPMIQYASRANKKSSPLPYPEIVNMSDTLYKSPTQKVPNCTTNVVSFGHDCTEAPPTIEDERSKAFRTQPSVSTLNNSREEGYNTHYEEVTSEIQLDLAETRDFKFQRKGRSGWPIVSTPYPYYNFPKPTPSISDRIEEDQSSQQTNIFAIPLDLSNENYSDNDQPRVQFTPPPYAFTPFPNFTDSYAQLSPYKVPKNYTNFEDIMKYLNNNGAFDHSTTSENPKNEILSRTTTMKVSGTYVMPLDRRRPGEIIVSSSENDEEARPFFNGHAYVSDPFLKFRPSNPLEINRLIPIKESMDVGPRFRRPVSFVPTSSIAVDILPPLPPTNHDLESSGSQTVAIFHPPAPDSQRPPLLMRPTTSRPKEKPFSVTLDIYPVTMEMEQEVTSGPSPPPGRERVRLKPSWRPKVTDRPRWRPQAPRRPSAGPQGPPQSPDNHMIVHLNLFPNKRKPYVFPRRGLLENTTRSTTTLLPGVQYEARSDIGESTNENTTEDGITPTNIPLLNATDGSKYGSHPSRESERPEYSALGSSVDDEESTTLLSSIDYSEEPQENSSSNNSSTIKYDEEVKKNQEDTSFLKHIEKTPQETMNSKESEEYIGTTSALNIDDFFTTESTKIDLLENTTDKANN